MHFESNIHSRISKPFVTWHSFRFYMINPKLYVMTRILFAALFSLCVFSAGAQLSYKGHVYAPIVGKSLHSNSGEFLYVEEKDAISVYSVDQSNGSLKRIQKMATKFGGEVSYPQLSGDNKFFYGSVGKKINGESKRTFVMYSVDPNTGKLKFLKNFENDPDFQNDYTAHFSLSPKGDFMFIGKDGSNSLAVYRLDKETGYPKYLSTYETEWVQHFSDFRMSSDQKYMYVGGGNSNKQVVVYAFDEQSGQLTQVQAVENIGHWASSNEVVISADGKHMYQPNGLNGEEIIQFNRDPNTGLLTYQETFKFKANGAEMAINFFYGDRNTDFLYGLKSFGDGDALHVIQRDPNTGRLSNRQSFFDTGATSRLNGVFQLSFSRNNKFVYASGMWDGALNIFHNPEARETMDLSPAVIFDDTNDPYQEGPILSDGYNTPSNGITSSCNGNELSSEAFRDVYSKLAAEGDDVSRLNRSFELLEGKCIKVVQASGLAYLFTSEYQRLQFVKFIAYFLHDPQNKHMLADLFQYENMRTEVLSL